MKQTLKVLLLLLILASVQGTSLQFPKLPHKQSATDVWISIFTELGGNVWTGFVQNLYRDEDITIERGQCFGEKTFNHLCSWTLLTKGNSP